MTKIFMTYWLAKQACPPHFQFSRPPLAEHTSPACIFAKSLKLKEEEEAWKRKKGRKKSEEEKHNYKAKSFRIVSAVPV
jgi:hypothetical protein